MQVSLRSVLPFLSSLTKHFEHRVRIQGGGHLQAVEEHQVSPLLRNFNPYTSMTLDEKYPGYAESRECLRLTIFWALSAGLWPVDKRILLLYFSFCSSQYGINLNDLYCLGSPQIRKLKMETFE